MAKGLLISKNMPLTLVSSLKRSMNFLDNVWGKKPRYLDMNSKHVSDIHEVAFNLINEGQINQAIELLNTLDLDKLSFNQKGFHFYLKGLISKNIVDYCESVKNFKKSGDSYYRRLPLMQLKNLNVDDCIIEAMAA
ncbi:hypothetical protein E0Y62_26715 [Cytobacillus praedii]|uniref:Uncharacterized protein n=1 Tax=Cytobacillus praedii TaxID=1742358 RepID=A0A4R1ALM0_9BACI|nr:hypothetical protein E0Y62_26715 [Cytobacillus praedii]